MPSTTLSPPSHRVPAASPRPRRRRRRWPIVLVAAIVLLAALFYLGGGWYFSGVLHQRALDPEERIGAVPSYDDTVVALGDGTVTLRLPADPGNALEPGVWGLEWPGGYGQVGAVLGHTATTVTRVFHHLAGSPLSVGRAVAFDNKAFTGDPQSALGLAFRDVAYRGPLGAYPAWFVPGQRDTWAVLVHGNSMSRLDTLRLLPVLAGAGYPALVITVRGDPGAPKDPSGIVQYGRTEWQDLEAAVVYATAHGARDVVLVGQSMGGGIVASFLERSALTAQVRAVILDAPMLDFGRAVDLNAAREKLPLIGLPVPSSLTWTAKQFASIRYGVDWGALDYLAGAASLRAPILLFHGTDDETVPVETSDALAAARPDLVTYVRVSGAGHLDSWNVDPTRYESAMASFLATHAA